MTGRTTREGGPTGTDFDLVCRRGCRVALAGANGPFSVESRPSWVIWIYPPRGGRIAVARRPVEGTVAAGRRLVVGMCRRVACLLGDDYTAKPADGTLEQHPIRPKRPRLRDEERHLSGDKHLCCLRGGPRRIVGAKVTWTIR